VHWQALGYSGNAIGALWAIGVIAEIVLFAFSGAAVRAAGAVLLIVAGAAAGALRWTLMAFDPPLLALIVLQTLHALTYGATHLAAVHFIAAHVPRAAAGTAQALYASATAGIGMGAATLLAGKLYAMHGAYAYLAMTVLSVGGGLAVAVLMRWQRSAPGVEA
jgi:PPP family 3-phenylpropionic acid transporter